MKHPFIEEPQTVQYDVLHAIESGVTENSLILAKLCKLGRSVTIRQVQTATRRLYQGGIIQRTNGQWALCTANKWRRIAKAKEGAEAVRPNGVFAFYMGAEATTWRELSPPFTPENAEPGINRNLFSCTDDEGHKYTLALLCFGGLADEHFNAALRLVDLALAEFGVSLLPIESTKVPG